jgi:hypothetical protein
MRLSQASVHFCFFVLALILVMSSLPVVMCRSRVF